MNQKELYERQTQDRCDAPAQLPLFGGREAALLRWIRRSMGGLLANSEIRVAELSVGDGQLSRALAHGVPGATIDCVDISPTRLETCRRLAESAGVMNRMRFLELNLDSDFDQLPTSSYDLVIAVDILEHVFDPFAFVRHCHSLLTAGGELFLRVPNVAYIKRRFSLLLGDLPVTSSWFETPGSFAAWKRRHGWDGGHLHYFTIASLYWLLREQGFTVVSAHDIGSSAEAIRRLWPGMLFGNIAVHARK